MRKIVYFKQIIEWVLSLYVRIRPKKTFYSLISPIIFFILGEFLKNDGFIRLIVELSENSDNSTIKFCLNIFQFYLLINIPNIFLWLAIFLCLVFSYLRFLELREKWKIESIELDKEGTSFRVKYTHGKISFVERMEYRRITEAIELKTEKQISGLVKKIQEIERSKGLLNKKVIELSKKINHISQIEPNQKVLEFIENFQGKKLINYSSLFLKSFNYFIRGDVDKALSELSENEIGKIDKQDDKKRLFQLKARILQFSHDYKGAKVYYEKIYELDIDDIDLILEAAAFLQNQGDYDKAADLYNRSLEIVNNPKQKAIILNNYGVLNKNSNNFELSEQLLQESLKIREEICLKDSKASNLYFLSETYNSLGNLYSLTNDIKSANKSYTKSFELGIKIYEMDSDKYGKVLVSKLSALGHEKERAFMFAEALELFNRAIKIIDNLKDNELRKIQLVEASVYNNMGLLFRRAGFYKDALMHFNKSAKIVKGLYNINSEANSKFLVTIIGNLGTTEMLINNYDSSKRYYLESIEVARILVKKHKKSNLGVLSSVLFSLGKLEALFQNYESCLKYINEALGLIRVLIKEKPNSHLLTYANSLNLLAVVQLDYYQNYESAIDFSKRALEIFLFLSEESQIIHNQSVCKMHINLASLYKRIFDKTKNNSHKKLVIEHFNEAKNVIEIYSNNDSIPDVNYFRDILNNGIDFKNNHPLPTIL